jgi:hypothetical protein
MIGYERQVRNGISIEPVRWAVVPDARCVAPKPDGKAKSRRMLADSVERILTKGVRQWVPTATSNKPPGAKSCLSG